MACLVLAIIFLVLTAVIFFRFRILQVIAGRAQKKGIEQMREENQRTGRLRHAEKVAMGEYTPVSLNNGNNVGYGKPGMQEERTESLSVPEQTVIPSDGKFTLVRDTDSYQ
jgi:hypothetical protein